MPFDLSPSWSDESLDIHRRAVRRFVETELEPAEAKGRETGDVGKAIWRRAGELGFLLNDIPEEFGGGGGDVRHELTFFEECARRGLSGMSTGVHSIVAHYFLNHGTETQKREYLPRLARGEIIGAISMTESDAGSDLQAIRTTAARRGEGYVLNGSKTYISNGTLAGVNLVVAKTDTAKGAHGISIFIVEPEKSRGYRVGRKLDKIGLAAQDTSELFFDDVELPADALLGGVEGRGFVQLMTDLPYERLIIGIGAAASIEGAIAETLAYVKTRKAFGRTLFEFQNTRFRLAELVASAKAVRAMVDRGVIDIMDGKLDAAGAAMIKLFSTEQQGRIIDQCLQFHGGAGYMMETSIARRYADARITRIFGGANEIMMEMIARSL